MAVWHHCPRSQAVAAAMSSGRPSSTTGMASAQRVLLGSADVPLQGLLTCPQVWLQLHDTGCLGPGGALLQLGV